MSKGDSKIKVEIKDDDLLIFIRLSKAGYGTIEDIKRMNAREVIQAMAYENYLSDYQEAMLENS